MSEVDGYREWYVELVKVQLAEGGARADATRAVLGRVPDVVLRPLRPSMPVVTERLHARLAGLLDWTA